MATRFFIDELKDAVAGPVGLVTVPSSKKMISSFLHASRVLHRRGIIINALKPHSMAGCEFARVLIDDRPWLFRFPQRYWIELTTRIRVEGAGPKDLKWVRVPW